MDGKLVAGDSRETIRDEAAYVSRMYHLQRFVTACAGRGRYPIKFNGTSSPCPAGRQGRRRLSPLGPRLLVAEHAAAVLRHVRVGRLRPDAAAVPDVRAATCCRCRSTARSATAATTGPSSPSASTSGATMFSETYGWTPFEQRTDKLQASGWHKWEWVGGLELCWLMLDYYDHTHDRDFLRTTAHAVAHEILTFFDQHYPTNADGKLVMHPSQALETWWECTNPMPEVAGLHAVTERLLALPRMRSRPPSASSGSGCRPSCRRCRRATSTAAMPWRRPRSSP